MSLLLNWFGIESIDKDLKRELDLIEELLEDVSDINGIVNNIGLRKKKLKKVLAPKGVRMKNGFSLKRKVQQKLKPYVSGEKRTKDLVKILVLHKMLTDFDEDLLWKELIELWNKEYSLLLEGTLKKVRENLEEQKRIVETLKKIAELEFNETHLHFGPNVDAHIHWEYLKQLWDLAEKEFKANPDKLDAEVDRIRKADRKTLDTNQYTSNIILLLEAFNHRYSWRGDYQRIYDDDKKALYRIMNKYRDKTWTETKAFVEFEKLLIMPSSEYGTFRGFHRKADILQLIQDAANASDFRSDFLLKNLDNIVQHNLAHNITHIEIRYPINNLEDLKFWADMTEELEKKYKRRISIRYVQFPVRSPEELISFYKEYKGFPKELRKYIVGVDFGGDIAQHPEVLELAEQAGLPLCVHAGELFKPNAKSVTHALQEVETALNHPTVHRIGHATILGIDIGKYLKRKAKPAEIDRLEKKQAELIKRVREQGVYIEANPSSNVKIAGLNHYGEHPIDVFSKQDIKFAISTDDRIPFDTNLKKEFYRIARAMKWSHEQIEKAAKMQKEAMLK
jgi:adenosine deaminase